MKKNKIWIFDLAMVALVAVGFEIIDYNLAQIQATPFYYDYLSTARWLLMGGFTLHGLINYFLSAPRGG